MKPDRRQIIFIGAFLSLYSGFYAYTLYPGYIWHFFGASVLFSGVSVFALIKQSGALKAFWPFISFPVLTLVTLYSASTLPTNAKLLNFMGIVAIFLIAHYLKLLYIFVLKTSSYRIGTLENFAVYANLIVFFLLSLSLFGYNAYLDTASYLALPIFSLLSALILNQFFWAHKFPLAKTLVYLATTVIIMTETAYALALLPFDFFSCAVLLTLVFYSVINLQKIELQDKLTPEKIRHYLALTAVGFILIYLTAQWL